MPQEVEALLLKDKRQITGLICVCCLLIILLSLCPSQNTGGVRKYLRYMYALSVCKWRFQLHYVHVHVHILFKDVVPCYKA